MTALPTTIIAGDPGHIGHHNTLHALVNPVDAPFGVSPIYPATFRADRPAAGQAGRLFTARDTGEMFFDDGVDWRPITPDVINPASFGARGNWNGTTGVDSTDAINAALASISPIGFTPPGSSTIASVKYVILDSGRYKISDQLDYAGYLRFISDGEAIIEQVDPTKDIFVGTGCYQVSMRGLSLVGGRKQFVFENQNVDSSKIDLDRMAFIRNNNDHMIDIRPPSPTTLNGAITDVATALVTNAVIAGLANGGRIAIDSEQMTVTAGAGTTNLTVTRAGTSTGFATKAAAHSNGAAIFYPANLSVTAHISNSRILEPYKAMRNHFGVSAKVSNTWVRSAGTGGPFAEDAALFENKDTLLFDHMYGVPDPDGPQANQRWVDNYGEFRADKSRFGGEGAGMPIVYQYAPPQAVYPFIQGGVVSLTRSHISSGPSAGHIGIMFMIEVPQLFEVVGCSNGIHDNANVVIDLTGGLAAYINALGANVKCHFSIGPNLGLTPISEANIPPALYTTDPTKVTVRCESDHLFYSGAGEQVSGLTPAQAALTLNNRGASGRQWRISAGRQGINNSGLEFYDVTSAVARGSLDLVGNLIVQGALYATNGTGPGIRAGNGVPGAGTGNNGDIYFNAAGGTVGVAIYQKRAGAWVAVA